MDPARLVYLENVPPISEKQIEKVLRPLGLEKWTRLDAPFDGSAYAQFGSAAKVKAALEVLRTAGMTATVSEETKKWLERTAKNASVQSVIRMQPGLFVGRIKAAFDKAPSKPDPAPNAPKKTPNPPTVLPTDDDNVSIQREIAEFHEQAREAEIERQAKSLAVLERIRAEVATCRSSTPQVTPQKSWDEFVAAQSKWQEQIQTELEALEKVRDERSAKKYELAISGDPLGVVPDRDSEREADEKLWPLSGPTIESIVAEFFGDEDDDVIAFVKEHLENNGQLAGLKAEFEEILGPEESQQFAEKIMQL